MKYKFGPAILAGVLALSSGVSHADDGSQSKDRAQYVQTKLTEGLVSVVAIGIGQQKGREYQDEKVGYLHRVEANEYSLNRMNASDGPLIDWLDTKNQEWDSLKGRETRLTHQIGDSTRRLRWMSKTEHPDQYAKLENEIRSLKGELDKTVSQYKIIERRNKTLALWVRTGQGDISLTAQERKSIKTYLKMKRELISESHELTKKATVAELKSAATMVAYIPAAIVVGTTVNDMVSSSKRMEKAQASSQSSGVPAEHSQGAHSAAAK